MLKKDANPGSPPEHLFGVLAVMAALLLGACGTIIPTPSASLTPPLPTNTSTPLPTGTYTGTPESSACMQEGKFHVLSDDVIFALGPAAGTLEKALADNYPEWAEYEQAVRWQTEPARLGEIVREASFREQFAVNPAVTLVTLGESLDWQLPSDGRDLFFESLSIAERLNHLWFEWTTPENEDVRSRYPEVSNAATYAVYAFFEFDQEKLKTWCSTYQRLFGTSP